MMLEAAATATRDGEPDRWYRFHEIARHDGITAALRALGEETMPGVVPFGPGGHAVVPDDWPPAGLTGQMRSGTLADPMLSVALGEDRIAVLRRRAAAPRGQQDVPQGFATGLCWVLLGTSRWLLAHAVEHARQRKVGDESLLRQQMIKAMVADALTVQLEAEALLDGAAAPGPDVLVEASARILMAGRIALRLLGASGFTVGLASHTAWVSELIADAYLGPEGT